MTLNEGLFTLSLGKPFEPIETMIVKALVKSTNTVVDLGANIGYYTLLLARQVGETGSVIAFEPSPTNYELLEQNVRMNGYNNVETNQLAVSDKSGRTRLYLSIHPADNRIYNESSTNYREPSKNYVDIQTVSLDYHFRNSNKKIDFIKMDVQGAEYSAVQGMSSTLRRNKNIKILAEFSPKLLKEFGTEPATYLGHLQEQGFILYDIDQKELKIEQATPGNLLNKYTPKSDVYTNLLLTRDPLDDNLISGLIRKDP